MSLLKQSGKEGMEHANQLKEKPKYYLFGLLAIGVYIYSGFVGVAFFYIVMTVIDYILMKKEDEI